MLHRPMERIRKYVRGKQRSHWLSSWLPPCLAKCGAEDQSTLISEEYIAEIRY